MKLLVFVVFFFACSIWCLADCDATISSADTIGDVKKELACLADENATLKKQLASSSSGPLRIHYAYVKYSGTDDACKTRAIDVVVKRGGSVTEQGPGWVDLQLGEKALMFACGKFSTDFVQITVAGHNHQEIMDLAKILGDDF